MPLYHTICSTYTKAFASINTNVAIPRDVLGTEHTNFALDWVVLHSCYLANFDETKRSERVIVQATHGMSKSKQTPLYVLRTLEDSFSRHWGWHERNTFQSARSKVLKTIKGFSSLDSDLPRVACSLTLSLRFIWSKLVE